MIGRRHRRRQRQPRELRRARVRHDRAIANGMALHGGVIPYVGTFLVFSDYARNAIRMAAPDEAARATSSLTIRSASAKTARRTSRWSTCRLAAPDSRPQRLAPGRLAGERGGLRQRYRAQGWADDALPVAAEHCVIARDATHEALIRRGGYILSEAKVPRRLILIATGSEVGLALGARRPRRTGIEARVVSMPCTQLFDAQSPEYKEAVLRPSCRNWPSRPA